MGFLAAAELVLLLLSLYNGSKKDRLLETVCESIKNHPITSILEQVSLAMKVNKLDDTFTKWLVKKGLYVR